MLLRFQSSHVSSTLNILRSLDLALGTYEERNSAASVSRTDRRAIKTHYFDTLRIGRITSATDRCLTGAPSPLASYPTKSSFSCLLFTLFWCGVSRQQLQSEAPLLPGGGGGGGGEKRDLWISRPWLAKIPLPAGGKVRYRFEGGANRVTSPCTPGRRGGKSAKLDGAFQGSLSKGMAPTGRRIAAKGRDLMPQVRREGDLSLLCGVYCLRVRRGRGAHAWQARHVWGHPGSIFPLRDWRS